MSIRADILSSLLDALIAADGINGVADDQSWDFGAPPEPAPSYGRARHPFCYVFEGDEQPNDTWTTLYDCTLPVTIECTYEYSRTDATQGLKPQGRELLAVIQQAVMADPNRNGHAENTIEITNAINATAIDGIGVVVLTYQIPYVRSRRDPSSQDAAL